MAGIAAIDHHRPVINVQLAPHTMEEKEPNMCCEASGGQWKMNILGFGVHFSEKRRPRSNVTPIIVVDGVPKESAPDGAQPLRVIGIPDGRTNKAPHPPSVIGPMDDARSTPGVPQSQ